MRVAPAGFRAFALAALAALVALGAPACGPDRPPPEGSIVVALPAALQTLNPLTVTQNRAIQVQREIAFDPLVRYDAGLQPRPALADWDTAALGADSLRLTFRLRPDARWHDGRPIRTGDLAATWELMRDEAAAFPFRAALSGYDPRIEIVDSLTARFRLRRGPEPLEIWYQVPPVPAHVLGTVPPGELRLHPFGRDTLVGSGPFRLVRAASDLWVFEADTTRADPPRSRRVVLQVVADPTAAATALLTGTVQVMLDVPPDLVDRLRAQPDVRVVTFDRPEWTFIAWNQRRPPFEDVRVRRALDLALDRDAMVQVVLSGLGVPGHATVTPAHPAFDPDAGPPARRDTAGARALLARAGWADRDGDGILEDGAGRALSFRLVTNAGNPERAAAVEMVRAQLAEVGVDVRPEVLEFSTLAARIAGAPAPDGTRARDFDAVLIGWNDPVRKSDSGILHSAARDAPNGFPGHASPALDSLLDRLDTEPDAGRADGLWRAYQARVRAEVPLSVLYYPRGAAAVRREVEGVEMDRRGGFVTVAEWRRTP